MNPCADKIIDICKVLQITTEQFFTGKGIETLKKIESLEKMQTGLER